MISVVLFESLETRGDDLGDTADDVFVALMLASVTPRQQQPFRTQYVKKVVKSANWNCVIFLQIF